ncbi:uncharacterized protein PFL1_04892 [Pseudozyma flocculosa PF-1]|uniref:Aminotransferase class I/classII large domain-containing protein n=1 Tax=Pseudozyma flocculosa PF-1 TaxID=1277687 RepID=A0A061H6W6_9BASI|nr:uncharacterized protein PFL1_04892 [Pseudozyma flocculosa PF-1]EPQ27755.1 hypothetical protein PFL1_04892 [Pseudozyma flocculosa PF-1]
MTTDPASVSLARDTLTGGLRDLDIADGPSESPQSSSNSNSNSTLSGRGRQNASFINEKVEAIFELMRDLFDPETNPNGIVNLGVADNALCRNELLQLTYADRMTASSRLFKAIAGLFNTKTPDYPESNRSPLPLLGVEPEHIAIGSGATGILDQLFWALCDHGDGVLLSTPYYNAFDNDLTSRAGAVIVPVAVPVPKPRHGDGKSESESESGSVLDTSEMVAADTVRLYEDALLDAQSRGTRVKVLLFCNPHNPSGAIAPRQTVVGLARLAAKHKLHFVCDEIYARSCFATPHTPHPPTFHSVLSIDVRAEAGLDPAYVHVVTSASKDFGINGFRLGLLVSQHNRELHRAMTALGLLAQSAAPAAALWRTWLEDHDFLAWYLEENRRRMAKAYAYVTDWLEHYGIPYADANSGHFFLADFTRFLGGGGGGGGGGGDSAGQPAADQASEREQRDREGELVGRMLKQRVFVAPGSQYHHPSPGWFRVTFTQDPRALRAGLQRLARVFGLDDGFEDGRELLDLEHGGKPSPLDADAHKVKDKGVSPAASRHPIVARDAWGNDKDGMMPLPAANSPSSSDAPLHVPRSLTSATSAAPGDLCVTLLGVAAFFAPFFLIDSSMPLAAGTGTFGLVATWACGLLVLKRRNRAKAHASQLSSVRSDLAEA